MLARIHPRASTERNLRPETMALARRIISALKAQTQPHILLVDNADLANEETRRALSMIEQASLQPLLMDYPTLLFFARRAGEESRPSIKIAPWSSQSISQYLESIFPGRRVSEQLKREATERSMGLPKRLLQWCVRAAEVRALTLSDTTLSLSDTVQSPEVYDAEDARDLSLSSLEDHERRVVELIACARATASTPTS